MGELIEIVFEALGQKQTEQVYKDITGKVICLNNIFDFTEEAEVFNVVVGKVSFSSQIETDNVHLNILRYEEKTYDIEINFDLNDVKENKLIRLEQAFYIYASNIANRNNIKSYYAGLEPAHDEDTRFFTGNTMGPLKLP